MSEFEYDVFISYSHEDRDWVRAQLLPRLEAAGHKVLIDYRDFEVGTPSLINMEQAVEKSRHTITVLTPAWVDSQWAEFESLLVGTADPAGRQRKLIPLLVEPCELPRRIAALTYADLTDPATQDEVLSRLLRGLGVKARIFISYKRNAEPDDPLATRLQAAFEQAGHTVYMDKKLQPGVKWAAELEAQILEADFMVVLLSKASAQSEMLAEEVKRAYRNHQETGQRKSRLLPVRVQFDDTQPYELSHYLDELQYVEWNEPADEEPMIRLLLDVIGNWRPIPTREPAPVQQDARPAGPRHHADPRSIEFIESLPDLSRALDGRSEFYIEREQDTALANALRRRGGSTATVRAPQQTGKTSLLIHSLIQAKERGSTIVFLDLQAVPPRDMRNLDDLVRSLMMTIVAKLRLDPQEVDRRWQSRLGANVKAEHLLQEYILPAVGGRMVLAIDKADRLLETEFYSTFFGLIRSWHNRRADFDPEPWDNLDIVLAISTEPHLLIKDPHQSPFNVGDTLRLDDFGQAQVAQLNDRYRSPLAAHELPAFVEYLGGHPYLSHRALYTLVTDRITWKELAAGALSAQSPFGDHLHHYLPALHNAPELRDALKAILKGGQCSDENAYHRLLRAGLIKGSRRDCALRCELYREYLSQEL